MTYRIVNRKRRSKLLAFMLFPALIFIAIIGWYLNSVDSQHSRPKETIIISRHQKPVKGNITFMPAFYAEEEMLTH